MNRKEVERIREMYKKGDRIRLIYMDDIQAPAPGTCCTVRFVDDAGQIHVDWDSGGNLALLPDEDKFELI